MTWMDAVNDLIEGIVKQRRINRRGHQWYDDPARVERAQRTGIRYTDDELAAIWRESLERGEPPLWSYNEYKRAADLGLR